MNMKKDRKNIDKEDKQFKVNIKKEKKEKPKKVKVKNKRFIEHIRKNKRKYIVGLTSILLLSIIIGVVIFINIYLINKKYRKYEEKMNVYGFNTLYDNDSAKSYEKITKLEAIKLAIGSIYNIYDVTFIGYQPEGKYDGDEWVKTAEAFGIIEKNTINEENINKTASYWDFIQIFLNTRNVKLKVNTSYKVESNFKNLNSLNPEQQKYVNDLVEHNLIENQKDKINIEKDAIKGQVNQIVINYVNEYNSIVDEGETLVTKKESMPKNSDIYPYIVYSIPNEVYEFDHINNDDFNYISPKKLYKDRKEYYNQMEYRVNNYYDEILNIDYRTINIDEFIKNVDEYLMYAYDRDVFEEYVNYVKENKIVIEGSAKALKPIIYYDGILMRVRTKITFKIVSSDTDKNILFGDIYQNKNNPITYQSKEYTLYADVPMGRSLNAVSYRTDIVPLINIISDRKEIKNNTL